MIGLKPFWQRSLLHSMFITRNIQEFVKLTELPKRFQFNPFKCSTETVNQARSCNLDKDILDLPQLEDDAKVTSTPLYPKG